MKRAFNKPPKSRWWTASRQHQVPRTKGIITNSVRLYITKNRQPESGSSPSRILKPFIAGALLFSTAATALSPVLGASPEARLLVGSNRENNTMSSKLIPSNPSDVMVIRDITPHVVTLSVPFARYGKLKIGGRGTIVKLTSGPLAVFSPVALTPEVKAKIAELGGTVQYIVALDFEHHIFISDWAKEFPEAKIIGPEGLPEKRLKMNDEKIGKEAFFAVFEAKTKNDVKISEEFDHDFEYEYIDAHPNKEIIFFYKPDKVLIEADLMFNLPAKEQYSRVPESHSPNEGILSKLFGSIQTTAGDAKALKRFTWHVLSRGNRASFNESIRRINEWDFTTVIPCHGDTMQGNGKEIFEKVFEWHLEGHKK